MICCDIRRSQYFFPFWRMLPEEGSKLVYDLRAIDSHIDVLGIEDLKGKVSSN